MGITVLSRGCLLITQLSGELDVASVRENRAAMEKALRQQPFKKLILDLTEIEFMDSSGLGFILGRYKQLEEQGREMVLVGARNQVSRVLKMSGVEEILPSYLTLDEAIEAMEEEEF